MSKNRQSPPNQSGRNTAPVELTGDAGGGFEAEVAAYFLAEMLNCASGLGEEPGQLRCIRFQTKDMCSELDDLGLEVVSADDDRWWASVSVKRNKQVTQKGFPPSFVEAVWRQRLVASSDERRCARDQMVLAVGELAAHVESAWHDMLREATEVQGDESRLVRRWTEAGQASKVKRQLFESLHCPPALSAESAASPVETVALVRALRLRYFDFRLHESRDRERGIELCRSSLRSGDLGEARRLWNAIIRLAHSKRQFGGTVNLPGLVRELHGFALNDFPDYADDWRRLLENSEDRMSDIRTDVGSAVSLVRHEQLDRVAKKLATTGRVVLVGESGTGKSALAKRLAGVHSRTVWLTPEDFDNSLVPFCEQRLGLRHRLAELLEALPTETALLVIDGAERLTPAAARRLCDLLAHLAASGSPWRFLVTVQSERWDDLARQLRAFSPGQQLWEQVECGVPGDWEIDSVLRGWPKLRVAASRKELGVVLRNLKILDWVIRHGGDAEADAAVRWVGLTDVMDWLWAHWAGNGRSQFARSSLLKMLAAHDAETLIDGVPLQAVAPAELDTLHELARDRLLRIREERVYLEHDLLGDWARVLILVEERSHISGGLCQRACAVRWHRAIRLFGQRLLERDATGEWERLLSAEPPDETAAAVVRDLLLESAFCAVNASLLLERIWPVLIANNGQLLRRLIQRFLHVATVPDRRMLALAKDEQQSLWFAAQCRVAGGSYWSDMVPFLHRHRSDLVGLAPVDSARLAQTWLTSRPFEFAPGRPWVFRRECAEIAILIAREFQAQLAEGVYFHDGEDEPVFSAALHAALDLPSEVSQFALELCCRRDESAEIAARRKARDDKQAAKRRDALPRRQTGARPTRTLRSLGRMREPWPDGPIRHVAESFRKVCLGTTALQPLMASQPEIAKEVILAVCIEAPRCTESSESYTSRASPWEVDLGIEEFPHWPEPMYFRGPFLSFLRICPHHGIDVIVRLANFATNRWMGCVARSGDLETDGAAENDLGVSVVTASDSMRWLGDLRVFEWYRSALTSCTILPSALMALEKYLYDELEERRDIAPCVQMLFQQSRTVAILGVLVAVAKKHPELLKSCLRPVLATWQMYGWDQTLVHDELWINMGFFRWTAEGEQVFNIARDWTFAEHRKQLLTQQVTRLLISDPDVEAIFEQVRAVWKRELANCRQPDDLERLIVRFDANNYRVRRLTDEQAVVELVWPEALRGSCEAAVRKAEDSMRLLQFPMECRRLLDAFVPMSSDELKAFWSELQYIADKPDLEDDRRMKAAAVVGGVTVLVVLHRDWLAASSDRERWCGDRLGQIIDNQPSTGEFDCRESITNHGWSNFLGECFVALLAEDANVPGVRAEVGAALMSFHYETAGLAMRQGYRLRYQLGDEFLRMQNLAVLYSGLSYVSRFISDWGLERSEKWRRHVNRLWHRLHGAFVRGSIPISNLDWTRISDHAYDLAERAWQERIGSHKAQVGADGADVSPLASDGDTDREPNSRIARRQGKARRRHPGFDIQYLPKAFEWLPELNAARNSAERLAWIRLHRQLLNITLLTIAEADREEGQEIEGTPYPYDHWIFERVAQAVAQMRPEERPDELWQSILDLGPEAHYWVTSFLHDWLIHGSRSASTPEAFTRSWGELIRYLLKSPSWQPGRSYRCRDVQAALFGIDLGMESIEDAKYAAAFAELEPLIAEWAGKWLQDGRLMAGLARFLALPSADRLLVSGLKWVASAFETADTKYWRDDIFHWRTSVVSLLSVAVTRHRGEIATDSQFRRAFQRTLSIMIEVNAAGALQLQDEVLHTFTDGPTVDRRSGAG